VVHRSFDESTPLSTHAQSRMTQSGLLKENIDGEALQWASERLRRANASRRIIIVISDGAPVDDSTLSANGPNILDDHLRDVVRETVLSGEAEIYGVGIDYEMFRYYQQYVVVSEPRHIADVFIPMLTAILNSKAHAPDANQPPPPSGAPN
jgi:cobaltochelatase CobT